MLSNRERDLFRSFKVCVESWEAAEKRRRMFRVPLCKKIMMRAFRMDFNARRGELYKLQTYLSDIQIGWMCVAKIANSLLLSGAFQGRIQRFSLEAIHEHALEQCLSLGAIGEEERHELSREEKQHETKPVEKIEIDRVAIEGRNGNTIWLPVEDVPKYLKAREEGIEPDPEQVRKLSKEIKEKLLNL
ncbi:MAG: hypothetical protein LBH86_01590 [Oscillospiraceae bacterium]|jgi:hypothetical protein|nr:hypothetical protein [Oscillospiraceae bacterium]